MRGWYERRRRVPPWLTSVAAAIVGVLALLADPSAGRAGHAVLADPEGRVILEIRGAIGVANDGAAAAFDRAMLEALGTATIRTTTPWTDGVKTFEGVLVSDVLDIIHATGDTVVARALNDYEIEIPVEDFRRYPVLLALKMDEQYLRIRDKGPVWIVYPRDEFSELDTPEVMNRWVWQLETMTVE